jgi:hypothetical protein
MDDNWLWHSIIYKICKEINYNPNQVYELNIIDCLNWLSFFKERDEYEQKVKDTQSGITRY